MYVVLSLVLLLFLNIYASTATRQLLYRSKESSVQDKTQMIAASFAGSANLSSDVADQVVQALGDLKVNRILITDGEGRILLDSLEKINSVGMYAMVPEIVQALNGKDIIYCEYESGVLVSHAAVPVMYRSDSIGCVYISELDEEQGAIIRSLEANLSRITFAVEAVIIVFSILFAIISSRKMRMITLSMRKAREGDYDHKIAVKGWDEYSSLANDFNSLTDRLQESAAAQRQFVSDASHELKTPLASIKLLTDSILQNDMDAETTREFVSDIGDEADRLTRMAHKLLDLGKAENYNQEHELVNLSETVGRVYKMLVPLAADRRIRLTCTTEPSCTVLTVGDDMYQIFFNLVENAIKYNTENGQVHVALRKEEDDIVVTVEDTGIGIPEEAKPHVFDRFYRVDKARSRQAGGSGIGLSIVNDLVKRNLGEVSISDREEGGTCFTVRFPSFELEVPQ